MVVFILEFVKKLSLMANVLTKHPPPPPPPLPKLKTKGHKETFGGDEHVYYLGHGDGIMGV